MPQFCENLCFILLYISLHMRLPNETCTIVVTLSNQVLGNPRVQIYHASVTFQRPRKSQRRLSAFSQQVMVRRTSTTMSIRIRLAEKADIPRPSQPSLWLHVRSTQQQAPFVHASSQLICSLPTANHPSKSARLELRNSVATVAVDDARGESGGKHVWSRLSSSTARRITR